MSVSNDEVVQTEVSVDEGNQGAQGAQDFNFDFCLEEWFTISCRFEASSKVYAYLHQGAVMPKIGDIAVVESPFNRLPQCVEVTDVVRGCAKQATKKVITVLDLDVYRAAEKIRAEKAIRKQMLTKTLDNMVAKIAESKKYELLLQALPEGKDRDSVAAMLSELAKL